MVKNLQIEETMKYFLNYDDESMSQVRALLYLKLFAEKELIDSDFVERLNLEETMIPLYYQKPELQELILIIFEILYKKGLTEKSLRDSVLDSIKKDL